MKIIRSISILGLLLYCTVSCLADTILIIYVRSGDSEKDTSSMAALSTMTNALNSNASAKGIEYKLMDALVFRKQHDGDSPGAIDIAQAARNDTAKVYLVAHGVFSVGLDGKKQYTYRLKEASDDAVDETEVKPYFSDSFHCNQDGEISQNDIGKKIAADNDHGYSNSSRSTVIDSSDSSLRGRTTSGLLSGDGYWEARSVDTQYMYFSPDGTCHVVACTVTVYVWISTEGSPYNENMA